MAFKYQVLSCAQPQELLQITLNHLDGIVDVVKNTNDVKIVQMAIQRFLQVSGE